MRRVGIGIVLAVAVVRPVRAQDDLVGRYRGTADRIIDAALADSAAYARLTELVDRFGPRLSGSDNLERALDWILEEMRRDGLARVRGEPEPSSRVVEGLAPRVEDHGVVAHPAALLDHGVAAQRARDVVQLGGKDARVHQHRVLGIEQQAAVHPVRLALAHANAVAEVGPHEGLHELLEHVRHARPGEHDGTADARLEAA